jgi:hypothetical protein
MWAVWLESCVVLVHTPLNKTFLIWNSNPISFFAFSFPFLFCLALCLFLQKSFSRWCLDTVGPPSRLLALIGFLCRVCYLYSDLLLSHVSSSRQIFIAMASDGCFRAEDLEITRLRSDPFYFAFIWYDAASFTFFPLAFFFLKSLKWFYNLISFWEIEAKTGWLASGIHSIKDLLLGWEFLQVVEEFYKLIFFLTNHDELDKKSQFN